MKKIFVLICAALLVVAPFANAAFLGHTGGGTTASDVVCTDCVGDGDIDWGTGAGQVSASDVPNEDLGDVTVISGVWSVKDDSHAHVITDIDAFTEGQLETQAGGINIIVSTEIDTFSELNTLVADKTLVNAEDAVTWQSYQVLDLTSTEAFLVRRDADALDVFSINTTTPLVRVYGGAGALGGSINAAAQLDISNAGNTMLSIRASSSSIGYLAFGDEVDNYEGAIQYDFTNDSMVFVVNDGTKMTIDSIGRVLLTSFLSLGTATELTIASGAVTAIRGSHKIDTESDAASDDLDTINGGSAGDVLTIRAENALRDVVVKDGTGNLFIAGDFTLDHTTDTLTLLHVGTGWIEITRSDNAA